MGTGFSFDKWAFDCYLNEAAGHYGKPESFAPLMEVWLDLLAERLRTGLLTVKDLRILEQLHHKETGWEPASAAQNRAYKALYDLKMLPEGVNSW